MKSLWTPFLLIVAFTGGTAQDKEGHYRFEGDRYYVGGLSMGGKSKLELVRRKLKIFATPSPFCGGAKMAKAKRIKRPAWWIFQELKDNVVPPELNQSLAEALKGAGANVKLTLPSEANHNSWDAAFGDPALLSWLISHKKIVALK